MSPKKSQPKPARPKRSAKGAKQKRDRLDVALVAAMGMDRRAALALKARAEAAEAERDEWRTKADLMRSATDCAKAFQRAEKEATERAEAAEKERDQMRGSIRFGRHKELQQRAEAAEARVRSLEEALRLIVESPENHCPACPNEHEPVRDDECPRAIARAALSETRPAEPGEKVGAAEVTGSDGATAIAPNPSERARPPCPAAEPASPETKPAESPMARAAEALREKARLEEEARDPAARLRRELHNAPAAPPEPRDEERCECGCVRSFHRGIVPDGFCIGSGCDCDEWRPAATKAPEVTEFKVTLTGEELDRRERLIEKHCAEDEREACLRLVEAYLHVHKPLDPKAEYSNGTVERIIAAIRERGSKP